MILNDVQSGNEPRKARKRIGRGVGSGHGKTAGRGHKGFFSRSGSSRRRGFQGGQMPLFRRVAKRGFSNNFFASDVAVINIGELNDAFEAGAEISPELLAGKGLIPSKFDELKVLGDGEQIVIVAKSDVCLEHMTFRAEDANSREVNLS